MAKIIYACSRDIPFGQHDERKLWQICSRLEPDNLSSPVPHKVTVRGKLAWAIMNNRNAVIQGNSIMLGCLYGRPGDWHEPKQKFPDGSYAIFRNSADCLEAVSDASASRTIWYYLSDEHFIASTSQRAIVMFLGSFEFNAAVIPWVLSTGSLGPQLSWDTRIKRLAPDSSVVLDKNRWSITARSRPIIFAPIKRSRSEHKRLLLNEVRTSIQSLKDSEQIKFDDYLLPLSGGYDSRAILCFLSEGGVPANLTAITWGLKENLHRPGNDAAVATELARKIGVKHRYFHTDVAAEPMEKVIDRFIRCAEGRIDHVSAYMDGLEIWRRLAEEERCNGIIRGDEGCGWIPVSSESTVRLNVGMGLCTDFRNLKNVVQKFGLPQQDLPVEFHRRKRETLQAWRDRLYHAYRLPSILAALSDVKYSYVEVVNPLLARSILYRVRELPDALRTDKALFKEIVHGVTPPVPFAHEGANEDLNALFRKKEIVQLMRRKIDSEEARRIFGRDCVAWVLRGLGADNPLHRQKKNGIWHKLKALAPRSLKNWIRDLLGGPSVDANALAFRAFLVIRMHELLSSDCAELARSEPAANAISPKTRAAGAH